MHTLNAGLRRAAAAATIALAACSDDAGSGGGTTGSSTATTGGSPAATTGTAMTTTSSSTGTGGAGGMDVCGDALLCETFEDYAGTTTLADGQTFGPWRAALSDTGASMSLDGAHASSGASALHMRIESGADAGGRLFADGNHPLFAGLPTHLYGRMMMYVDPNGTSVHWTFFGASGDAEPSSPVVGRRATYLMSSLPRNGENTYSFVYGLEAQGNDPFHDCWFQSEQPMPTAGWQCVAFEMDSVARKLRMTLDGSATPSVSVDDTGQGCVGNVPGDSLWYGPAVDQIYVGAWSFHPMDAPLEVWIDDLVVDDAPVACP